MPMPDHTQDVYELEVRTPDDDIYTLVIIQQWQAGSPRDRYRPIVWREGDDYPLNPDGKEVAWFLTIDTAVAFGMPYIRSDYEARHEPDV